MEYIHESVAYIARNNATLEAVVMGNNGGSLSYHDLIKQGSEVSKSISAGETIALLCTRDVSSVVALVAASIAGGSLLPLAPWDEASRSGMKREAWENSVGYALQEGKVRQMVCDAVPDEFLTSLAERLDIKIVKQEEFLKGSSAEKSLGDEGPRVEVVLKLLSGGSTGSPKLHLITHMMMLSEHENYRYVMKKVGSKGPWRVLQQSPSVWPASQFGQINIALALGGTLVISWERSARELAREIEKLSVDVVGGAPSQLGPVAEYLSAGYPLKVMFAWGEALSRSLGDKLRSRTSLKSQKTVIVELLVATEYWLCMFCADLSGKFETVPNCQVRAEEMDGNGIGQLTITGPMVAAGSLTTQDLIRIVDDNRVEFIGRKDFLTKIGGNWFDVREIEAQLLEAGQWISPRISQCVVVSSPSSSQETKYSLFLSVEEEEVILPCDMSLWLSEVRGIISRMSCPVTFELRVLSVPLPLTATKKVDRKALVSLIHESTTTLPNIAEQIAVGRFRSELFSQTKWASLFAFFLGPDVLWAPYMYLATLYLPRSDYLPRSRVYSGLAAVLKNLTDVMRRNSPFGVSGLIVLLSLWKRFRGGTTSVMIFRSWTLMGIVLALLGDRLLSWPLAFWTGAGAAVRDDCSYWISSPGKWKNLLNSILINVASLPDMFLGTDLCAPFRFEDRKYIQLEEEPAKRGGEEEDPPQEGSDEVKSPKQEEEDEAENTWWSRSPVEYIRLGSRKFESVERTADDKKSSVENVFGENSSDEDFILNTIRTQIPLAEKSSSLKSLSSLQITELVQKLRVRISTASARALMDSSTVEELIFVLLLSRSTEKDKGVTGGGEKRYVKVQFSPGQINRPCRWMIRSAQPFDKTRLREALEKLTDRHPLLRSELADPKPFHSFLYDGAVMVANCIRFSSGNCTNIFLLNLMARAVHASWVRLFIHPPGNANRPRYWSEVLTWSKVSDFENMRRSIVSAKRELEEAAWNTHQRPLTAHIYSLPEGGREFLMLSVKHSVSDGNSAFPLLDELATLYETTSPSGKNDMVLAPVSDPIPELESRLKAGIFCDPSNPNRTSLRTQIFYSRTLQDSGGGYYRHYICIEKSAALALRKTAAQVFEIGFDAALLSILIIGLMRADSSDKQTITLYSPMRDGAGESGIVGLLADWRDLTVQAVNGASLYDFFRQVANKIKNRDWEPTLSPAGPESVLLNWLAFDGTPRLADKSWEQYHVDKITQRWNKMDQRDFDANATPSGRFRSMSLEQYETDGDWWLRVDVATNLFPPKWMIKFSKGVNDCFCQILNNPLYPALLDQPALLDPPASLETNH